MLIDAKQLIVVITRSLDKVPAFWGMYLLVLVGGLAQKYAPKNPFKRVHPNRVCQSRKVDSRYWGTDSRGDRNGWLIAIAILCSLNTAHGSVPKSNP